MLLGPTRRLSIEKKEESTGTSGIGHGHNWASVAKMTDKFVLDSVRKMDIDLNSKVGPKVSAANTLGYSMVFAGGKQALAAR